MTHIDTSIKVEAFNIATGESVGIFESYSQASRKLFIRNAAYISQNIRGEYKKGVKSYKNDIRYTFKIIE